jgi:hypothetical protein
VFKKTGYSRPHTVHCGPEGIYVSTLGGGGQDGTDGPPGIFIMDCQTFDILGRWEIDRGPRTCTMISGGTLAPDHAAVADRRASTAGTRAMQAQPSWNRSSSQDASKTRSFG